MRKRLPPLTTLDTRLINITRSINSWVCKVAESSKIVSLLFWHLQPMLLPDHDIGSRRGRKQFY